MLFQQSLQNVLLSWKFSSIGLESLCQDLGHCPDLQWGATKTGSRDSTSRNSLESYCVLPHGWWFEVSLLYFCTWDSWSCWVKCHGAVSSSLPFLSWRRSPSNIIALYTPCLKENRHPLVPSWTAVFEDNSLSDINLGIVLKVNQQVFQCACLTCVYPLCVRIHVCPLKAGGCLHSFSHLCLHTLLFGSTWRDSSGPACKRCSVIRQLLFMYGRSR